MKILGRKWKEKVENEKSLAAKENISEGDQNCSNTAVPSIKLSECGQYEVYPNGDLRSVAKKCLMK